MHWGLIGYAVACVVTPVLWGLMVVWASKWVERIAQKRRTPDAATPEETPLPPVDYHI